MSAQVNTLLTDDLNFRGAEATDKALTALNSRDQRALSDPPAHAQEAIQSRMKKPLVPARQPERMPGIKEFSSSHCRRLLTKAPRDLNDGPCTGCETTQIQEAAYICKAA